MNASRNARAGHGTVAVISNTSWSLVNFRGQLIKALRDAGYRVIAIAPEDRYSQQLQTIVSEFVPVPMHNGGTNPARDLLLLVRLWITLRKHRPHAVLGFTAKPNIYGALAARALNIPMVSNIAGLGAAFVQKTWLTTVVKELYRIAMRTVSVVFFQNQEDLSQFVEEGLVDSVRAHRLPGSGVDLKKFSPESINVDRVHQRFRFLLVARMLWEKGVGEYVDAARQLRQEGYNFECCMLGFADVNNPSAISREQLNAWSQEGVVQYLGETDDVRSVVLTADCVVLPSFYKEGVPRSLLEAAALERPIITTNQSGCRDAVDDGVSGLLCRPRDIDDLKIAMRRMLLLPAEDRRTMGQSGRRKMIEEFDERLIIQRYLDEVGRLMGSSPDHQTKPAKL